MSRFVQKNYPAKSTAPAKPTLVGNKEAQVVRVIPPLPPAGKRGGGNSKSKRASDDKAAVIFTSKHESDGVILDKRVSDVEKALKGAEKTTKYLSNYINAMQRVAGPVVEPVASEAGGSAAHVQNDLQKDVTSNTSRIAVVEGQNNIAVGNQGMFSRQIVDLQEKISTIEEKMKQAAPESKDAVQPSTRKRLVSTKVQTGVSGGQVFTDGEDDASSEGMTPPRLRTPKRYVVCMMCLLLVFLQLLSANILLPYAVILCFIASHPRRRSIVTIFLMVCL